MFCGLCVEDFKGPYYEVGNDMGVATKVCPTCYAGLALKGEKRAKYIAEATRIGKGGGCMGSSATESPYERECRDYPTSPPDRLVSYKDMGFNIQDTWIGPPGPRGW